MQTNTAQTLEGDFGRRYGTIKKTKLSISNGKGDSMWSPFYGYYCIKTPAVSNSISTKKIEEYLKGVSGLVLKAEGSYSFTDGFLDMQLMNVADYDSWSGRDYNSQTTNYIAIEVSKKDTNVQVMEMLNKLANYLGLPLTEEEE